MSRGTAKKAVEQEVQPNLIFDAKRDINPFWRSSLFSDVYLKNDVPREYKHLWENDEIGGFYKFYQGFVDLCVETEHECFEKWKEADTVKNWIVHVMDLLGWENNSERRSNSYMDNESFTILENGRKQTFRPDLVYFDKPKHKTYTQKEKDIDRKIAEAKNNRTGAKIIVEAKYWDRLSQLGESSTKETKVNDSASALGPELQTLKYMEMFDHDFGILTDGKTWRLFHSELSQGMDRRSFDFDLGNLREIALDLTKYGNEEKFSHFAKYFYYFFSKESLIQSEDSKTAPFVHEVFEYSKKYAHSIEDDLKKRFIITMGITCNSLKKSCEQLGETVDLDTIRNVAESHLFNILFVKSCEVRRILPISSTQYLRVSLHEVIESIDAMNFDPDKDIEEYLRDFKFTFGKKFDWDGVEIFNRFINLFEIIHDGTAKSKKFGFEIEGFKESIFEKKEWKFAKIHKITNKEMVKILFNLNFIESSFKGRKYQQIPYSYFSPRQLGSIYESFLEYRIELAEEDMIFKNKKWEIANLKSKKVKSLKLVDQHVVTKDELFFSPDNKDRKMTGSYYTPDHIVRYIVEKTLGPYVEKHSSSELLHLKICDPAMGSGHFLAGALDYLVEAYRRKWCDENNDDLTESLEESSRKIVNSCLYGVDINPRAVKLAKMSMWLITASAGKKLEPLSNHLHCFDFLEGTKNQIIKEMDAFVTNPPYGETFFNEKYKDEVLSQYSEIKEGRNVEIYQYFLYAITKKCSTGAYIGFISPNTWLSALETTKFRNHFFENLAPIDLVLLPSKVFPDATVDCLIYVGNVAESHRGKFSFTDVRTRKVNNFLLSNTPCRAIDVDEIIKDGQLCFDFDPVIKTINLSEKIVDSYFNMIEGIHPYKNKADRVKKFISDEPKGKGPWEKVLASGKNMSMNAVEWSGEYVKYGKWLHNQRKPVFFENTKLLVHRLKNRSCTQRLTSAIDTEHFYTTTNLTPIIIRDEYKLKEDLMLSFLNTILNSRTMNYWYRIQFDNVNILTSRLKSIPLPNLDTIKFSKKEKDKAHSFNSEKQIEDFYSELDGFSKEKLVRLISNYNYSKNNNKLFNELYVDLYISKLYNLKIKDVKIIMEHFVNLKDDELKEILIGEKERNVA